MGSFCLITEGGWSVSVEVTFLCCSSCLRICCGNLIADQSHRAETATSFVLVGLRPSAGFSGATRGWLHTADLPVSRTSGCSCTGLAASSCTLPLDSVHRHRVLRPGNVLEVEVGTSSLVEDLVEQTKLIDEGRRVTQLGTVAGQSHLFSFSCFESKRLDRKELSRTTDFTGLPQLNCYLFGNLDRIAFLSTATSRCDCFAPGTTCNGCSGFNCFHFCLQSGHGCFGSRICSGERDHSQYRARALPCAC